MKKILCLLSVCGPLILTAQSTDKIPSIKVSTPKITDEMPPQSLPQRFCFGYLPCGTPSTNFQLSLRDYYPDSAGLLKVARIISYKVQSYHAELLNKRRPMAKDEMACNAHLEVFYTNNDTVNISLVGRYELSPGKIKDFPLLAFSNIEAELIDGKKVYLQDFTVTQLNKRATFSVYVPFEKYYESEYQIPNDPKRRYGYKVIGHLKNNDVTVQYARYGKCRLLFSFEEYTHFDFTDISFNNNGKREKIKDFTFRLPQTK